MVGCLFQLILWSTVPSLIIGSLWLIIVGDGMAVIYAIIGFIAYHLITYIFYGCTEMALMAPLRDDIIEYRYIFAYLRKAIYNILFIFLNIAFFYYYVVLTRSAVSTSSHIIPYILITNGITLLPHLIDIRRAAGIDVNLFTGAFSNGFMTFSALIIVILFYMTNQIFSIIALAITFIISLGFNKLELEGIMEPFLTEEEMITIANKILREEIASSRAILRKRDDQGNTVAHLLAADSEYSGWSTDDFVILRTKNKDGISVAHLLALSSDKTKWGTDRREILKLKDKNGISIAHLLAESSSITGWTTSNSEILKLKTKEGKTVEQILKEVQDL